MFARLNMDSTAAIDIFGSDTPPRPPVFAHLPHSRHSYCTATPAPSNVADSDGTIDFMNDRIDLQWIMGAEDNWVDNTYEFYKEVNDALDATIDSDAFTEAFTTFMNRPDDKLCNARCVCRSYRHRSAAFA